MEGKHFLFNPFMITLTRLTLLAILAGCSLLDSASAQSFPDTAKTYALSPTDSVL